MQINPVITWQWLNVNLAKLSEPTLEELLHQELKRPRAMQRKAVVKRLYGRYNRLRAIREHKALLAGKWIL